MATASPAPGPSAGAAEAVGPVSTSMLLGEHDNDPNRALAALVSKYNRLVQQHSALRHERDYALRAAERSVQENEQLWRSFKSTTATAPSPRPPVARSNSDQPSAATKGLGIGPYAGAGGPNGGTASSSPGHGSSSSGLETPNTRAARRMQSNDSSLFSSSLRSGADFHSSSTSPSPLFNSHSSASPRGPSDPASHWLDYPPVPALNGGGVGPSGEPSPRLPHSQAPFGNYSPSALRGKSATPPPHPSIIRTSDSVPSSLSRKASSFDLGRNGPLSASSSSGPPTSSMPTSASRASLAAAPSRSAPSTSRSDMSAMPRDAAGPSPTTPNLPYPPRTPPPPSLAPAPQFRRMQPSSRMTGSTSMPHLLAEAANPNSFAGESGRFLPTLSPISPFSFGGVGGSVTVADENGSVDPTEAVPVPGIRSAGEQLQAQLQLPRRERTLSGNSALAAPFEERSTFQLRAAASQVEGELPPGPPPRSASVNVLSSATTSPFRLAQDREESPMSLTASSSLRERRPSVPNKLQYAPEGLGASAGRGPASAPASRVPSDGRMTPSSAAPFPSNGGLSALPSPTTPNVPPTPGSSARSPSRPPVLTAALLTHAQVRVVSSTIKLTERQKESVQFQIAVSLASAPPSELEAAAKTASESTKNKAGNSPDPSHRPVPTAWKLEKSWAELQALDAQVRSKANRSEGKSLASLPDKNAFKDHAPQRSDQRKSTIERYLRALTTVKLRDKLAICAFLVSDVVTEPASGGVSSVREGWLTKKGRAFGGWQTRYYVLTPGCTLAYYDTPGGTKVGEILLQTAQIGRQSSRAAESSDDAYAHALLIRTQSGKDEADHILCADNDEERDAWIQALTTLAPSKSKSATPTPSGQVAADQRERVFSTSSLPVAPSIPAISHEPDSPRDLERRRSGSGLGNSTGESAPLPPMSTAPRGSSARPAGDQLPPSMSLPTNLDALARGMPAAEAMSSRQVAPILEEDGPAAPTSAGTRASRMMGPSASRNGPPPTASWRSLAAPDRPHSPDKRASEIPSSRYTASDVSSPMNAVPLPSGFEFKKIERQKKTKSSFWSFTARSNEKGNAAAAPARPVFGVPLKDAVAVSRIRPGLELPAIVYRCVEFLEAKNAETEEGIFRLSGSVHVIRQLKDRFDAEGDVNLLQNASELHDPHAIAGLLKQYLRDLPPPLLTKALQPEFLRVIDLRSREEQVNALGKLVAELPIEEYTLFRFFFAHLCTIAQNAETSKMNLRNLGIVFSPTLAIPAPLFTLFLSEFDLVFAVDRETGAAKPTMLGAESEEKAAERAAHRNSQIYEASGANKLMESELLRLRENEEDDLSLAVRGTSSSAGLAHDAPAARARTPQPRDNGTLAPPSPPKSAGLPASPRPGASFRV